MTAEALLYRVTAEFGLAARPAWPAAIDEALASMSRDHRLPEDQLSQRMDQDEDLVRELAGYLTVGESHFLRHAEQYELLLDLLAERLGRGDSRIEVWSAGCSRGEEPLTLAILARCRFGETALERLHIVGSDICRAALDKARRGIYHPWSFRSAPPWFVDGNFTATGQGYYAATSSARQAIRFEHIAVQERLAHMAPASIDVLFFRNVAIYLAAEATTSVYEGFHRVLKDGGLLLTAPADPSPPRSLFARDKEGPAGTFWRRSDEAAKHSRRAAPQPYAARALPDPRPRPAWRPRTIKRPRTTLPAGNRAPAAGRRGGATPARRSLAGEVALARDAGQREQLMVSGRSHLEALRLTEAIADFRRVLFLNQRDCIGRFWYAAALQRAGHLNRARGQVAELSRQLCELHGDTRLEDGDTTAAALLNAVHLMEASL